MRWATEGETEMKMKRGRGWGNLRAEHSKAASIH